MTEMEMLKALRMVIAKVATDDRRSGKVQGRYENVKAEVRQELVDAVQEKFGLGTWSTTSTV